MKPILAGADPEIWLTKDKKIVPCVGLIKGTKEQPFVVPGDNYGLTLQEDNVTLELGWNPVPVKNFSDSVYRIVDNSAKIVRGLLGPEYGIMYTNAEHVFDPADLVSEQAQMFGCLPDQLAHEQGAFRKPLNPKDEGIGNKRFAGGHLHVGYDKEKAKIPPWALVQMMDLAYLFTINDGYDAQGGRRANYGLPGLYREKPYGVEYRTPSNFWMRQALYAQYILNTAQACLLRPRLAQKLYKQIDWAKVRESITTETLRFSYNELSEIYGELTTAEVEEKEEVKAA